MRKTAAIVMALAMLASFALVAVAEEAPPPVLPGDGLLTAVSALEDAQSQTSEGLAEQALLENAFANRRVEALGLALASGNAEGLGVQVLMDLLAEHEGNLGQVIAAMARGEDLPPESEGVLEAIEADAKERGWRLVEIVADDEMPEVARDGAQKALDNMEAAGALENGEVEGPPGEGLPDESQVPADVPGGRP